MVDIAQLVAASGCGPEGRGFESHYPPKKLLSLVQLNRTSGYGPGSWGF